MTDEHYMKQALKEAQRAFDEDEVPVGAIVVMNDRIIAKGYNQVEKLTDSTAHAEIKVAGTTSPFHPKTILAGGILKDECAQLMKDFFKARR